MHIDDFNQVAKNLEPDAMAGGDGLEPYLISIAVSAKRIADSLGRDQVEISQAAPIELCLTVAPPKPLGCWARIRTRDGVEELVKGELDAGALMFPVPPGSTILDIGTEAD